MSGSPEEVFTGRLVGGELDGICVEIGPGREVIEMGPPLVVFGNPPERIEELKGTTWTYRYVRVEAGLEGPEAIFEFVEPAERS